jgi:hypothetical protein
MRKSTQVFYFICHFVEVFFCDGSLVLFDGFWLGIRELFGSAELFIEF